METLFHFVAAPAPCGYLPHESWSLEYEWAAELAPAEYMVRLRQGWRRFGYMLFRPHCRECQACQSLRVLADSFRPNRSQRRVQKRNAGVVEIRIGSPSVSRAKLQLYDRYHAFQVEAKGWPSHPAKDAPSYRDSFVNNPFPTEEWCYLVDERLVAVSYVDVLPQGLSAIYCYYDPEERERCLGTWNVLSIIDQARKRQLPHVYLGYYVASCPSLAYKANFAPNELLTSDGAWRRFRNRC